MVFFLVCEVIFIYLWLENVVRCVFIGVEMENVVIFYDLVFLWIGCIKY